MLRVLLLISSSALFGADYDLLIRNARVVDGTGNPWFRADVGVRNGRIAAIGRLNGSAPKTIDAGERVLAPGFIDVHTHVEGAIEKVPRADNFLLDGVTSVITGNCGGSNLNLGEWFTKLEGLGLGINVGSLIGHNTVRAEVMGAANRAATADEIAQMQALVEKGMNDGAVGFSTGLIYIPGTYSNTEEVVALAKAAARHGGTYASHMRDEGEHVIEAITEAVTVGRESGMPVELSHFKIDNQRLWGMSDMTIALVERFRREGVDVVVDQYPYDHSSTNLGITLPSWALADGKEKIRERLQDAATRDKIAGEMQETLRSLGHDDYSYVTIASFAPHANYEGKTVSEINALKGRPANARAEIDTIFDMMLEGGAQAVYHSMGDKDVERIMRYPNTAVASDGGVREFGKGVPHPRSYGTNARVLSEYVGRRGVLTLEDGIRRMTSLPARTFHLQDRGAIREGAAADLVLFDPARVRDRATYEKPHQYSEGFDYVIVNGKIAVENGKITDQRGGMVLRPRPQL
jgi:N-acyl-D-amino-acid deacylase